MNVIGNRVTIKDIAKALGISPSTVSRALNDHTAISDETKKLVREKAKELGYIAFHHARVLKTQKTMTVGVIVPDLRNPFFLDFLDGIEKVLFPRKYKILLSTSNEDVGKERVYLEWLMEHGIDGILVSPAFERDGKGNLKLLAEIERMDIPVVLYDRVFRGHESRFDSVVVDNRGAIVEVVKLLRETGHDRIGIVLADRRIYTVEERYRGFKEGCSIYGLECPEKNVLNLEQPFDEKSDDTICDYLKRVDINAVIATNHATTEKIYRCLKRLNLRIPDDVSVVGFDDVDENEFFDPPVTVVKQPVLQIGKIAATLLLGRIDGEREKKQNVVLKAELVCRYSVKDRRG